MNKELKVGDIVKMKKQHPCGSDTFKITRIGMDFKLLCTGCGREVMMPRKTAEKSVKKIISSSGEENV